MPSGLLGAFFALVIGLAYGTVSGYYGGRIDNILMRVVDTLYAFPTFSYIILLLVTFKAGIGQDTLRNPFVRAIAELDTAWAVPS